MKKFLATLTLMILTLGAYAGSGKAIVPNWGYNGTYATHTQVYISNPTAHTLNVYFTAYKSDGSALSTVTEEGQISNNTLAAGKSGYFAIPASPGSNFGYAEITWSNQGSDEDLVGLVAHAVVYKDDSVLNLAYSIPINNGQPF